MLMLGGGMSLSMCLCVLVAVVVAVVAMQGGFGGGQDPHAFTACKDSYAMVCPPGTSWGEGAAKDMCCTDGRDKTNTSNCQSSQKLSKVTLYKDEDYKVVMHELPIGDLAAVQWNDQVSSIRVPPNHKVEVFEDTNFGGASTLFTASTPNVGSWNDKISSVKVSKTC